MSELLQQEQEQYQEQYQDQQQNYHEQQQQQQDEAGIDLNAQGEQFDDDEDGIARFHPWTEVAGSLGLNDGDIKKLEAGGIHTIEQSLHVVDKSLATMGISEQKIARIRQFSFQLSSSRFVSSRQLLSQRQKISLISTGAAELDGLLCGGIEPGAITELYGEFNTGKTQFCHTVACRAQLPRTRGGAEGRVLYIDTEGTFRPERIVDISNSLGIVSEECLDNIQVARAVSSEHQRELLKQAGELMAHDRYALIIVDSVTSLFRTDFNGRGQLADRQQRLGSFLRDLHSLATTYNVAVVITNQVVSDIAGAAMSNNGADNKKPIGGNILAHASTTRLQLKKGKGSTKKAKIVDSPLLPEGEAVFAICRGGLCDPVNDGQ